MTQVFAQIDCELALSSLYLSRSLALCPLRLSPAIAAAMAGSISPPALDSSTQTLCLLTVAWAAAYVLVRLLLPGRSKDFCNRCVSLLHVFVSLYFCSKSVQSWSQPLNNVGAPSTPAQASPPPRGSTLRSRSFIEQQCYLLMR